MKKKYFCLFMAGIMAASMLAGCGGKKDSQANMTEEEKEQLHIKALPTNLYYAVCAMEKDAFIREILGEHISNVYIGSKKDEWNRYCRAVTEWEVEAYLDKF